VALQREYPVLARQALAGNFQLAQSAVIIEVTPIKIAGARQMGFTGVGTEASRRLQSCFGFRQVRRGMVKNTVNVDFSEGELAICLEEQWITRHSLLQQIDRVQ